MVIAQIRIPWFGESDFDKPFDIFDVLVVKGKYGDEYELVMNHGGEIRKFALWGGNLNYMVNMYGADTEGWLKKAVKIKKVVVNIKGVDKATKVISGA